MLSRNTIALNINNLSDARYFAAYDVDIMVFTVSKEGDNLGLIKEIIGWVEGPTHMLHLSEWDKELARFALGETGATGLLVSPDVIAEADQVSGDNMILSDYNEALVQFGMKAVLIVNDGQGLKSDHPFYILPGKTSLDNIKTWIQSLPEHGFALSGGSEEKVGLKSFEEQDEMIELLMDEA
ncbi:MAG: hypothetical protein R3275_05040 [Saprospiraceae bacterium]|nr:hypothetical protein [Saprospiraceae bacterium]